MSLIAKFTEHPAEVGETYGQHFMTAMSYSMPLLGAAVATCVHAFLPFLFEKTGSECITQLHERLVTSKRLEELRSHPD